jgi:hypothetical protein
MEKSNFTFTINDGFCSYEFPLSISSENSIQDVAEKIYQAFDLKVDNVEELGKLLE